MPKKNDHQQGSSTTNETSPSRTFAAPSGNVDVTAISTDATPIGPQSKAAAESAMGDLAIRLAELQEKLFAQSTAGDPRSVLLLLQGMDTAGKDGVIKNVIGAVDPGGVSLASFKRPTTEELAHDFLWRIEKRVPSAGFIGVFNRSHYEDVLVVRVHDLVPEDVWSRRYDEINDFEKRLTDSDVTIVKCFLHISRDVQSERLLARLDDPTSTGSTTRGTSTNGDSGILISRHTPRRSVGATRRRRRGTSSLPTGSGTGTGPSRRCSPRRWRGSTRPTRRPPSMWRSRNAASKKAELARETVPDMRSRQVRTMAGFEPGPTTVTMARCTR